MLPADLVRARRRGQKLLLGSLSKEDRVDARALARDLIEIARASEGLSSEEVSEALGCVDRSARQEKLWAGLKKLVLDDCEFTAPIELDAKELRRRVFELASAIRHDAVVGEKFERMAVLSKVASELELSPEVVEQGLYGDLKGAQTLRKGPQLEAESLLERYELAQVQGVLLRAVRMVAEVQCATPEGYRRLFSKLKFRQLLYRLKALEKGGYEIEIEGPFSLFESVTKYGLQLSLIVPALFECDRGSLSAELRWGKERKELTFQTSWGKAPLGVPSSQGAEIEVRSEVAALVKALDSKIPAGWSVGLATELLEIPGVGLCIPDLKFQVPDCPPVYLEVLGFWSRDAVWKRVEWAQSGSHERVIFAASSRLRVKKEVLPEGHDASLYVFKGAMSAVTVLSLVADLAKR